MANIKRHKPKGSFSPPHSPLPIRKPARRKSGSVFSNTETSATRPIMTMRSGRQIAGRLIATPEPAEVPEAVNNGKPTVTKNFGIQIEKTNNYKALVLNSLGAKSSTGIAEAEFILYNIRYGLEEGGTTKHALVAESSRLMELLAIKGFDRRSNDKENDQVNHLQNSDRECLGYSSESDRDPVLFPGVSSAYTVKHSPKTIKALKRADAEYIAEHGPINNTYDLAIKEAIAASLPKPVNRTPEMMARILKGIPIVQAVNFSPVISDASNIISPSNTLPRSTMQKGTTKKDNPQKDTPLIPPKISPPKNTMPKHTPAKETLKRHNLPKNTSPKETLLKNTQQWNTPTFISPPKMALPLRKKVEAPMAPAYSPEAQPFMSFDLGKEIHTPPFPNGKKPRPVTTGKLKTGNRLAGAVSPATVPRVVSKAPRYPSKDFVAGEGQNTAVNTPTAPAFKKRGTGGAPAMRAANAKRQRVRSPVVSDLLPATNFTKKKNMNAK